jgi:hypothetical protein
MVTYYQRKKIRNFPMARRKAQLEINNFTRGLVTEASPLTFPENATLNESNFEIDREGSRSRRLGMDYENNYVIQSTPVSVPANGDLATSTYVWKNVNGSPDREFVVVQTGNYLRFFDNTQAAVSSIAINTDKGLSYEIEGADSSKTYGMSAVDGKLVVATGLGDILVFTYNGTSIDSTTQRLLVRDVFGVEDVIEVADYLVSDPSNKRIDLYDPENLNFRPLEKDYVKLNKHLYNLDNQGWGVSVRNPATGDGMSPIGHLRYLESLSPGTRPLPSNSDVIHVANQFNGGAPSRKSFYEDLIFNQPAYRIEAGKGYFIIDALNRGASREEQYKISRDNLEVAVLARVGKVRLDEEHPTLDVGSLPLDQTAGGATVLGSYSGRIFYGGFSGEVTDGDNRSPDLSSYIMFSQVVDHPEKITRCYQDGDPTSDVESDLVATDGGFIKIQGAYGINGLVDIGEGLVVLAENGSWLVRGEQGVGFSATAYEVIRLSEQGCNSPRSVVELSNAAYYWSDSGIFRVARNEVGEFGAINITATSIQSYFDNISDEDKRSVSGGFDAYTQRIRWLFSNRLDSVGAPRELVLDLITQSFSVMDIKRPSGSNYPLPVNIFEAPPYQFGTSVESVQVGGVQVQAALEDVVVSNTVRENAVRELKYLCITAATLDEQGVSFTFSQYQDGDFLDWKTFDGTGVDAEAFMVTGYMTGGDTARYKQTPSLVTHLRRTEDGFTDVAGDLVPRNQSSCKAQAQWEWANSSNSNRWGREIETYQYNRRYFPVDASDPYDTGFETITTKRKLRGKGKALSLKFSTSPGKDCQLLGWSMDWAVQGRV